MAIKFSLPPTIDRHEFKYTVPFSYIEPISRFVQAYCDLDYHSAISSDHFYLVNSLYFDTRGMEFLKQRLWGRDGRFNMRARFYGERGEPPYFLEIKQKRGTTGRKFRSTAQKDEWPGLLVDPGFERREGGNVKDNENRKLFLQLATNYAIEPKIFTQYRRKAFISTVDEYARVTMDICMKYRLQDDYNLVPDARMVSYDNENIYSPNCMNEASVVLELKCLIGCVPTWMLDLISTFELKQQGFSKYMQSSLVAYRDNGTDYMAGDRMENYCTFA